MSALIEVNYDARDVRSLARDRAPNQTQIRPGISPEPDFSTYSETESGVAFQTHWLAPMPLYFVRNQSRWLASHSLADLARYSRLKISPEKLSHLMKSKRNDGPGNPIFSGVHAVSPGDCAVIDFVTKELTIRETPETRPSSVIPLLEKDVEDALLSSILRTVGGAERVAFAISGGVDSTTLAALGRRLLPNKPLHCFTADTGAGNDLAHATRAARDLKADLRVVKVPDGMAALALHRRVVGAACHPVAISGNSIGFGEICRAARDDGFEVIIDGTGGDPIFGGMLFAHGVHWSRAEGLDRESEQFRKFIGQFEKAEGFPRHKLKMLKTEPSERIDYALKMRSDIRSGMMARWRSHHIANARAHGIRIGMPYLDDEIARFLWNSPDKFFQGGETKVPLRRILSKYVSDEVAWRTTGQGLRWPIRPFYKANKFAMARTIRNSGSIRRAAPFYWAVGAMGALPMGFQGRLFAAAEAQSAATSAFHS